MMRTFLILAASAALVACGEKEQTANSSAAKPDTKAWQGADSPYVLTDWKKGDKTSWESQIRNRGQLQNEYNRTRTN